MDDIGVIKNARENSGVSMNSLSLEEVMIENSRLEWHPTLTGSHYGLHKDESNGQNVYVVSKERYFEIISFIEGKKE